MQTSSERITETSWNRLRNYAAVKQMLLPECPTLNSLPVIHSPFTCPGNTRWVNPSFSFFFSWFSLCPFYLSILSSFFLSLFSFLDFIRTLWYDKKREWTNTWNIVNIYTINLYLILKHEIYVTLNSFFFSNKKVKIPLFWKI